MRRTTTAQKQAKGTYRPSRMKMVEVNFELTDDLRPPKELNSEAAISEWNDLAPKLYDQKLLTIADRKLLVAYCLEISKYFACIKAVDELGTVIPLKNGKGKVLNFMKNPNFDLADKALKNALQIGTHFGLTPGSRGKLNLSQPKENQESKVISTLDALRKKSSNIIKMVS